MRTSGSMSGERKQDWCIIELSTRTVPRFHSIGDPFQATWVCPNGMPS
jgi:hypothetical protein